MIRRAIDIAAAALLLTLLSPALMLIALAVRMDSSGPALFRQIRLGRHLRPFRILKFRTMAVGSETSGPLITSGDDSRVTRLGRHLRRIKADELPQLWNVLKGEMSLLGPRPEVPRYVDMFRSDFEEILSVRPGLADPASLAFLDEEEILKRVPDPELEYTRRILPAKLELAKRYVRERGLWTDLRFVRAVLLALLKKARKPTIL